MHFTSIYGLQVRNVIRCERPAPGLNFPKREQQHKRMTVRFISGMKCEWTIARSGRIMVLKRTHVHAHWMMGGLCVQFNDPLTSQASLCLCSISLHKDCIQWYPKDWKCTFMCDSTSVPLIWMGFFPGARSKRQRQQRSTWVGENAGKGKIWVREFQRQVVNCNTRPFSFPVHSQTLSQVSVMRNRCDRSIR